MHLPLPEILSVKNLSGYAAYLFVPEYKQEVILDIESDLSHLNIQNWNTSNISNLANMFAGCTAFNQRY